MDINRYRVIVSNTDQQAILGDYRDHASARAAVKAARAKLPHDDLYTYFEIQPLNRVYEPDYDDAGPRTGA